MQKLYIEPSGLSGREQILRRARRRIDRYVITPCQDTEALDVVDMFMRDQDRIQLFRFPVDRLQPLRDLFSA